MFKANANYTVFLYVYEKTYKSLSNKKALAEFFNKESQANLTPRGTKQSINLGIVDGTVSMGTFKKHPDMNFLYAVDHSNFNPLACYFVVFDCTLPKDYIKWGKGMNYLYLDKDKKLNACDIKNVFFQRVETALGVNFGLLTVKQEKLTRMFVPKEKPVQPQPQPKCNLM